MVRFRVMFVVAVGVLGLAVWWTQRSRPVPPEPSPSEAALLQERLASLTRTMEAAKSSDTSHAKLDRLKDQLAQGKTNVADAKISLEEAAGIYSERRSRTMLGRFSVAEERIRELIECQQHRCSDRQKAAAIDEAEQALNELSRSVRYFVQNYRDRPPYRPSVE